MGGVATPPIKYMTKIIGFLLTLVFWLYFMYQPSVDRTNEYRDQVLEKQAWEIARKAALEGHITPQIKADAVEYLSKLYFDPSRIQITGTETITSRGEDIFVSLRYPQGPTEIFNLFGSSKSRDYYYPIHIMSEHIEG